MVLKMLKDVNFSLHILSTTAFYMDETDSKVFMLQGNTQKGNNRSLA